MAECSDVKARFQKLIQHSDDLCRRSLAIRDDMTNLSQQISDVIAQSFALRATMPRTSRAPDASLAKTIRTSLLLQVRLQNLV
jgi:hypothetical protein